MPVRPVGFTLHIGSAGGRAGLGSQRARLTIRTQLGSEPCGSCSVTGRTRDPPSEPVGGGSFRQNSGPAWDRGPQPPGGNGAPNAPFPTGAGVGGMTPAAGAGFSVAGGEYASLGAGEGMLRRPGGAIESFRGASGSWLG